MANAARAAFWFVVPFGVTLLVALAFVTGRGERVGQELENSETRQPGAWQLVGRSLLRQR